MQCSKMRFGLGFCAVATLGLPTTAFAIDVPDYEFDWVVVGDPGNEAFDGPWAWLTLEFYRPVGKIDRVYRMTRTEVTVGQWFEFVEAYAPYYTGWTGSGFAGPDYTSTWIGSSGYDDDGVQTFYMPPGVENYPTTASLLHAARYCNWLHNDKAPGEWAFMDGAYDISIFDQIAHGSTEFPEFRRRPGARFWVSDIDEWTKGMYWDPGKDGPGQGGYWKYPHSSDEPPVEGVDTNAGWAWFDGPRPWEFFNVGSYPHAASPWGLLDGSGGEDEWLDYEVREDPWAPMPDRALRRGTIAFNGHPERYDQIGYVTAGPFGWTDHGFRLSGVVPCKADLAAPFGILDLEDIIAFVHAFMDGDTSADLAEPFGEFDLADVAAFAEAFGAGCE